MAIPSKAIGSGQANAAANVFKIAFSTALSTAPKYEAWDNSSTFPARDASGSTTAKEIFTGTTGNGTKPCLYLYDGNWTSGNSVTAPSASWAPSSATGGSANPNRLKGTTNYVTAGNTPGAAGEIHFNMGGTFGFDATVPSTTAYNYLLQIRYTYTGSAPTLTYSYNDGGTEGSPVWLTWTPGTHGMRHTNASSPGSPYKLTLPTSGSVETGEIWITT